MEALQRFAERLADPGPAANPAQLLTITRRRETERASRELDRILGIDSQPG
jgi:hypothetical protein